MWKQRKRYYIIHSIQHFILWIWHVAFLSYHVLLLYCCKHILNLAIHFYLFKVFIRILDCYVFCPNGHFSTVSWSVPFATMTLYFHQIESVTIVILTYNLVVVISCPIFFLIVNWVLVTWGGFTISDKKKAYILSLSMWKTYVVMYVVLFSIDVWP